MHPQFGSVASQCKSTNQPGPLHPLGVARNGGAKASVLPLLPAAARLFASAAGPHRADRRGLAPVWGQRVRGASRRSRMAFNPLRERGIPLEKQFRNWSELNVKPYE